MMKIYCHLRVERKQVLPLLQYHLLIPIISKNICNANPVKNKLISIIWFLFHSLQTIGKSDGIKYRTNIDTKNPEITVKIPTTELSTNIFIKFRNIINVYNIYYKYNYNINNNIYSY